MRNSLRVFATLVLALNSGLAFAQQLPGGSRSFPRWEKPTLESTFEQDEIHRKCEFFEFGRLQKLYLDFALENDVIASDDEGYTHGMMLGVNAQGDWGRWRLGYETRLFTEKFFLPGPPVAEGQTSSDVRILGSQGNGGGIDAQTGQRLRFLEITDFRLSYESRPRLDGMFHQASVGLQVYTDEKTLFGGRAQQDLVHDLTGSFNDYFYGDTTEVSGIGQVGLGFLVQSENRRAYCRPMFDVELNSQTDRSFLRAQVEAGFTICQRRESKQPILELVGNFQCTQFLENDVWASGSADLRLTPFASEKVRAVLNAGVLYNFQTADDITLYNDQDPIARIFFGLVHTF